MKVQTISIALACLPQCWSATWIPFRNTTMPVSGLPIVDDTGLPIRSTDLLLSIGTFDPGFASQISALNVYRDDQIVMDAFSSTGSSIPAWPEPFDGLFNTGITDADPGNLLLGKNVYLMIEYLSTPTPQVIVVDLKATFPEQDEIGNAAIAGNLIEPANVIFGLPSVPVDRSNYPDPLSVVDLNEGISFGIIPEPSTCLLTALAGIVLMARRRTDAQSRND